MHRPSFVLSAFGIVLAALLAASATAHADGWPDDRDRVLPCRPTIACTAELVPPGTFEVEAGYLYRRSGTGATQRSSPFLLKLTLAAWAQVQVGSNGYVNEPTSPAKRSRTMPRNV